jgi:hypothetical protein
MLAAMAIIGIGSDQEKPDLCFEGIRRRELPIKESS